MRNHAPHIWAADFFTVQTLTFQTLYFFFFIIHDRRRLVHVNITAHPAAEWVWCQLVAATPWNQQPDYLIRDRDRCYGGNFIPRAAKIGTETILTPVHAPKANAIAERVVGTLRRECLDFLIIINERHLRAVLREYVEHYNRARPHRSLELAPPIATVLSLGRPCQDGSSVGQSLVAYTMNTNGWPHDGERARCNFGTPQLTVNSGAHGFTQIVFAYASAAANNGLTMASLNANSNFYNFTTAIAMLVGRVVLAVLALSVAGLFVQQGRRPTSLGTLPTATVSFAGILTGVILIVGGLSYFAMLVLGPIAERLIGGA